MRNDYQPRNAECTSSEKTYYGLTKKKWTYILAIAVGIFVTCICVSAICHKKRMHEYHKAKHQAKLAHLDHVKQQRLKEMEDYAKPPHLRNPNYKQETPGKNNHGYKNVQTDWRKAQQRDSGNYCRPQGTHRVVQTHV